MKIAGIDPSMNSSGKVIMDLDDETFDIRDIQFYGYQPHINAILETDHVHIMCSGTDYDKVPMLVRQERAVRILERDMEDVKYVSFEDYAYGEAEKQGSNAIFQIGEFCGGVRYHFFMQGKGIITYGIPQIKHFATGNGGAQKPAMCQAVKDFYPQFYYPYFETLKQYESPHSDFCDAFWMCEILRNHIKHDVLGPDSLPPDVLALMRYTTKTGGKKKKARCLLDYELSLRSDMMFDQEAAGKRKKSVRKPAK
jgi:hypothetical protein